MLRPNVTDCGSCELFTGGGCPFSRRKVGAGQVLVGQGERPTELAFVRAGMVGLSAVAADGAQTWGAIRGPRSLIGLEGVADEAAACEARALTDVELCVAPVSAATGGSAHKVLALAVRELASQRCDLDLRSGPASARVARFLLAFERLVSPQRAISKAQIAALLGVRAETLSRVLRRFAGRGWLTSAASLAVADRPGLERAARG